MNENQILPDDPRLTAYALGELAGEECALVEAALRGDPALRSTVDGIRATAQSIEVVLAAEAATEERKPNVRSQGSASGEEQPAPVVSATKTGAAARKPAPRGELLRFPSLYFLIGSLAAACFAVVVALHEPKPRKIAEKKSYVAVPLDPSPAVPGAQAQAAIGQDLSQSGSVGNSADAAASLHFDARFEMPEVGLRKPPVVRLAENTPSGASIEAPAVPLKVGLRVSPRSPVGQARVIGGVTQPTPTIMDFSQFGEVPRSIASGGPATMFELDPLGAPPLPRKGAFGDLAANLGSTGGKLTLGATGGLANGLASAPPVGPFSGVRRPLPADRFGSPKTAQATQRNFYYLPDEKFVFRAVPYGSTELPAFHVPQQWIKPTAPVARAETFNTEDYAQIRDNDFAAVAVEPLSTFSLDVDTASYANLRRFLERGERPPRDAVRIEELVNYFSYRYAPPVSTDAPFAASLEVAAAPWNPQHRLVRIGLKASEIGDAARSAANLVFLIDVSGSMAQPAKLPLVQESLRLLVGRLRGDDRVAIVTCATQATLALPATPVAHAAEILAAVDALAAKGTTNGAMGLQLAYDIAKANVVVGGVNRVILCTDGDFNVGVTQRGDLARLIEEKAKSGVFLTVLGFGTGNLKDATLEQLADKGNGLYGYVDSAAEAKRLLVEQAGATLLTVAQDVKVQVEFNPATVGAYRLIGYENRLLRKQDFTDDRVDAGEIGAGHTVTALYEVVPAGAPTALSLADTEPLKYQKPAARSQPSEVGGLKSANPKRGTRNSEPGTLSSELLTVKVRYQAPGGGGSQRLEFPLTDRGTTWADASDDFKFAASVASFGMILRDSPYKGTATLASVAEWARQGLGGDAGGPRNEFLGLVKRAETMVQ